MILDPAFINDVFDIIKAHTPVKEHQIVADLFINVLDEHGFAECLQNETDMERELKVALFSHFEIEDEEFDDE